MYDENNDEASPLIKFDKEDQFFNCSSDDSFEENTKSVEFDLPENQQKYCNKKPIKSSHVYEKHRINIDDKINCDPKKICFKIEPQITEINKHLFPQKYGECEDYYPIHCAANSGRADYLQVLLKGDSRIVNQIDSNKRTALHIVIQSITKENYKTSFKIIETLINYNADINCYNLPELDTPLNLIIRLHCKIGDIIKEEWQKMLKYIDEKVDLIDLNLLQYDDVHGILKFCCPALWKNWNDYECHYRLNIKAIESNLEHFLNDKKKFFRILYTISKEPKLDKYFQTLIEDEDFLNTVLNMIKFDKLDIQTILEIGKKFVTEATFYRIICDRKLNDEHILKELLDIFKERGYGTFKKLILHKNNWSSSQYKMLLNHSAIDLNMLDENGDSALCYHIGQSNKMEIQALMKKNVFIGSLNVNEKITAMDIIDPEMLEEYLNSCITMEMAKDKSYEKFIQYNYKCFKPPSEYRSTINELTTINCISSNKKLKHLILHPLITSFLLLKWNLLCPIFYLNLIIYFINFIMLTAYMTCFYAQKDTSDRFAWMPFIFALILLIREVLQLKLLSWKQYFRSFSNYIRLILIVLTFFISLDHFELDSNRRGVGALAILLAAMELILLFETIPIWSLSLYLRMLKKVTATFIRAFAFFSVILMGFASSFFILFGLYGEQKPDQSTDPNDSLQITNPAFAVLKTIVMFAGEFEASELSFELSNWIGYLIFVMFVFFISIIMMNLLSGLAVWDTQQIISDARLDDWIVRAKLLERFEEILITNKQTTLDDLIPNVLRSHAVRIPINNSAKLIDSQYNTQHIADHLTCFNLRTAEKTTIIDMPVESKDQLALMTRLKRNHKARFEERTKRFLTNFSIDEFDIVKNSLQIFKKCVDKKREEIEKKKNKLDHSRAYEKQFEEVFKRQDIIEENLNMLKKDILKSIKGLSSQIKK